MPDFIATTLSEVHIGSGQTLTKNLDFALGKRKNEDNEIENVIGILDINKIGKLIGTENIEIFIEFIDKKGTKNIVDFIGEFTQENKLENISKRVFCVYGDFSNKNFLREQLINSDKNPIIPGSSVKGAIRTAIISYLVGQNKQIVRRIIDKEQINKPFATWKEKDFQKVETKILNKLLSGTESIEANKNTMRFLIVGDVEFAYETIAFSSEILNYYFRGWNIKQGQSILTELISDNCESEPFRININKNLLDINLKYNNVKAQTDFLQSLDNLFEIINNHTKKLIENEINFWNNQDNTNEIEGKIDEYLQKLENIYSEFSKLKKDEMIIRIGGNTGWSSITGGWAKEVLSKMEWDKLYHLLNKNREVNIFPKTRKITDDFSDPFGIIKISQIKE